MSQVSGLFTRRAFNIDSIAVGTTESTEVSTMSIVLSGDGHELEQFRSQLLKLADVIEVRVLPFHGSVARELLLIRVQATETHRIEIINIAGVFDANILEIGESSMLIEMHGNNRRINSILRLLSKYGIEDMARTGQIALEFESDT